MAIQGKLITQQHSHMHNDQSPRPRAAVVIFKLCSTGTPLYETSFKFIQHQEYLGSTNPLKYVGKFTNC